MQHKSFSKQISQNKHCTSHIFRKIFQRHIHTFIFFYNIHIIAIAPHSCTKHTTPTYDSSSFFLSNLIVRVSKLSCCMSLAFDLLKCVCFSSCTQDGFNDVFAVLSLITRQMFSWCCCIMLRFLMTVGFLRLTEDFGKFWCFDVWELRSYANDADGKISIFGGLKRFCDPNVQLCKF